MLLRNSSGPRARKLVLELLGLAYSVERITQHGLN